MVLIVTSSKKMRKNMIGKCESATDLKIINKPAEYQRVLFLLLAYRWQDIFLRYVLYQSFEI
jgi:hypothetical protein